MNSFAVKCCILVSFGYTVPCLAEGLVFPQFVSGELGSARNSTRIILRNSGLQPESGAIVFRDTAGEPVAVEVEGTPVNSIPYSLPPFGTLDVRTDGTGELRTGVVEIQPTGSPVSSLEGSLIYEILGSRVSVQSSPVGVSHRLYVSVTDKEDTGIAIYNPSASPL